MEQSLVTPKRRKRVLPGTRRTIPKMSARDLVKQDEDALIALLDSNLANSNTVQSDVLDSPTYPGYTETLRQDIDTLTENDRVVAPMKVAIVSIAAKLWKPEWDTRKHQTGLGGLKSLRTIDHKLVASHLHKLGLYRTPTEGFLTRTFERKHDFTMDYPGEITPVAMKLAFLRITNRVNTDFSPALAETMLRYLFQRLQARKDLVDTLASKDVGIATGVSLRTVRDILSDMFKLGAGISVTPAIVTHTIFSSIQPYLWSGVVVSPLKHHTASDSTSKAVGDVEAYKGETPFASVEIKHNLTIDDTMVRIFTQKTAGIPLRYMLTTKAISTKYTDENIILGNVVEVLLPLLHVCLHADPDLASKVILALRTACMTNVDLSSANKVKIDELFTKYTAPASDEQSPQES